MPLKQKILKPSQNKKGRKFFQLHRFLNPFLQLAAEKKDSKNGAARNFFGPSYFDPTLKSFGTDKDILMTFFVADHHDFAIN